MLAISTEELARRMYVTWRVSVGEHPIVQRPTWAQLPEYSKTGWKKVAEAAAKMLADAMAVA